MGNRLKRRMQRGKTPVRGDRIFVRDEAAGDCVNGLVNAVTPDGFLVVAVNGHSKGYLVQVRASKHGKDWWWPREITVDHSTYRDMSDTELAGIDESIRHDHVTPTGEVHDVPEV